MCSISFDVVNKKNTKGQGSLLDKSTVRVVPFGIHFRLICVNVLQYYPKPCSARRPPSSACVLFPFHFPAYTKVRKSHGHCYAVSSCTDDTW